MLAPGMFKCRLAHLFPQAGRVQEKREFPNPIFILGTQPPHVPMAQELLPWTDRGSDTRTADESGLGELQSTLTRCKSIIDERNQMHIGFAEQLGEFRPLDLG